MKKTLFSLLLVLTALEIFRCYPTEKLDDINNSKDDTTQQKNANNQGHLKIYTEEDLRKAKHANKTESSKLRTDSSRNEVDLRRKVKLASRADHNSSARLTNPDEGLDKKIEAESHKSSSLLNENGPKKKIESTPKNNKTSHSNEEVIGKISDTNDGLKKKIEAESRKSSALLNENDPKKKIESTPSNDKSSLSNNEGMAKITVLSGSQTPEVALGAKHEKRQVYPGGFGNNYNNQGQNGYRPGSSNQGQSGNQRPTNNQRPNYNQRPSNNQRPNNNQGQNGNYWSQYNPWQNGYQRPQYNPWQGGYQRPQYNPWQGGYQRPQYNSWQGGYQRPQYNPWQSGFFTPSFSNQWQNGFQRKTR